MTYVVACDKMVWFSGVREVIAHYTGRAHYTGGIKLHLMAFA